jgi:hypothetical protein
MTTALALLFLFGTVLLVIAHLPAVLSDTAAAIRRSTRTARREGTFLSQAAFVVLWLLIFGLSFA